MNDRLEETAPQRGRRIHMSRVHVLALVFCGSILGACSAADAQEAPTNDASAEAEAGYPLRTCSRASSSICGRR